MSKFTLEIWRNRVDNPIPDWLQGRGVGESGKTLIIITQDRKPIQFYPDDLIVRDEKGDIYSVRKDD